MFRFKAIWPILFGDPDKISSERYFVALTSLVAAVFLLLLCIVHTFMGLGIAPVIFAGSSSLVMLGLYLFLRFGNCLLTPKLILTVVGLIILDLTWYSKYLSNGPVLFFILIFAALIIWVWEGKALITILIFYYLNLAVLGIIDHTAPEHLFEYDVPSRRGLDIYLSFFLYSSLMIFLLHIVKKEFTRQKEKAMKSDMLKSAFLANLSHEIRTPMNAIVGFSQLLNNGVGSDDKQQYINTIQNSSHTLLRLINDIIDLSKIEAGDLVVEYSKISVRAMFNELKDVFSIEIATRERSDVEIGFSISEDDIIIESDELRLKQILSNLLSNAIKFTSQGTVSFSCEKRGSELIFGVSDTGTGIQEEDQPKIFERFTKFNYQGLNTEGTGIGLSITEKLVSLLGGRIWFSSIPGKGSDFFFSIPYTVL